MSSPRRTFAAALIVMGTLSAWTARPSAFDPTPRTVYVTVTDSKGAPVPDLTAANFKVKEGGKDREIVKAEPAKTRPHLALMVEERLPHFKSHGHAHLVGIAQQDVLQICIHF